MRKQLLAVFALFLAAMSVWADAPWRYNRYDGFKAHKVTNKNIVFFGNSITNMHEWWEAFNNPNIINRGVNGAETPIMLENLESVLAGHPAKIFFMMGTNDLGTSGMNTPSHVAKSVRTAVRRCLLESPNTKVYVQSILPCTGNSIKDTKNVPITNDSLKKICDEFANATYIDLYPLLPGIPTHQYSADGTHLTMAGYRIWCNAIAEYVESKCVYPMEATDNRGGLGSIAGMRNTYFAALPVKANDIIIFGDDNNDWHELLHADNVKQRGGAWGYPQNDIATMSKMVDNTFKGRADNVAPKMVCLVQGYNEMKGSADISTVATNYENLVKQIRAICPNTIIKLLAVIPSPTADINKNRTVAFNAKLKEMAEAMANVDYVEGSYTALLKGDVLNASYMMGDRLNARGYAKLSQVMAAAIGTENGVKPTTDDEVEEIIARIDARKVLLASIDKAADMTVGDGIGQYKAEDLADMRAAVETSYNLLRSDETTAAQFTAQAKRNTEIYDATFPKHNKPTMADVRGYEVSMHTGALVGSQWFAPNAGKGFPNGLWLASGWSSTNSNPCVKVSCGAKNIEPSESNTGDYLMLHAGAGGATYTLSVNDGYYITGCKFTYYGKDSNTITIEGQTLKSTPNEQVAEVSDIYTKNLSFNVTGANGFGKCVILKDFIVYVYAPNHTKAKAYSVGVAPATVESGKACTLSLNLDNQGTADIKDVAFYVEMPECLTRTKEGETDKPLAIADDTRMTTTDHTIAMKGKYVSVTATNQGDKVIKGTSGKLLNLYYTAAVGVADGIYPVKVTNVTLTDVNGTMYDVAPVTSYVKVGNPTNVTLALDGHVPAYVNDAVASETAITTLDMSKVTSAEGNFTLVDRRNIVLPTADVTLEQATYNRPMNNIWGTVCLPFAVESNANVQYYTLADVSAECMYFSPVAQVEAGHPAVCKLLNPDQQALNVTAQNAALAKAAAETAHQINGGEWNFKGTMANTTINPADNPAAIYYISNDHFVFANQSFPIPAFRALFEAPDKVAAAQALSIAEGGVATDIKFVENADGTVKVAYGLDGRRISGNAKGAQIINKKKVMR